MRHEWERSASEKTPEESHAWALLTMISRMSIFALAFPTQSVSGFPWKTVRCLSLTGKCSKSSHLSMDWTRLTLAKSSMIAVNGSASLGSNRNGRNIR